MEGTKIFTKSIFFTIFTFTKSGLYCNSRTAFVNACQTGQKETVKLMLDHLGCKNIDLNARTKFGIMLFGDFQTLCLIT